MRDGIKHLFIASRGHGAVLVESRLLDRPITNAAGDTNDDEGHEEEDRLKDYEDAVRSLNAQRAKEGMAPLGMDACLARGC
jgi:hypothetical protein